MDLFKYIEYRTNLPMPSGEKWIFDHSFPVALDVNVPEYLSKYPEYQGPVLPFKLWGVIKAHGNLPELIYAVDSNDEGNGTAGILWTNVFDLNEDGIGCFDARHRKLTRNCLREALGSIGIASELTYNEIMEAIEATDFHKSSTDAYLESIKQEIEQCTKLALHGYSTIPITCILTLIFWTFRKKKALLFSRYCT